MPDARCWSPQEHWQAGDQAHGGVVTSDEEKAAIKALLPAGLSDPLAKTRTTSALAIASIAALDWPEHWPELTGTLVAAITERRSRESGAPWLGSFVGYAGGTDATRAVSGAMRCLSMIADDLDETSLPAVVPVLFPALLSVVQDPSAGSSLARRALQVVNACLLAVAYLPAAAAGRMRSVVGPYVPGWLALCAAVVESPLAPGDAQQCGLQMEALKVAQRVRTLPLD